MNTVWHLILITVKLSTSQVEHIEKAQYLTQDECQKEGQRLAEKMRQEAAGDKDFYVSYSCEAE